MIVPVTPELLATTDLTGLGNMFYQSCKLPGGFKLEVFRHNWDLFLKHNLGVMWFLQLDNRVVGALGGMLGPDVNDAELVATEFFWFVEPDYRNSSWGMKLYFTFENWARSVQAKRIIMVHLMSSMPDRLKKFYLKRDFVETEITYTKVL